MDSAPGGGFPGDQRVCILAVGKISPRTKRYLNQPRRKPVQTRRMAFEYTATLAEVLLGDERAQALSSVPEVRHIFLWHAVEESEHKSVAFDVFQQVCSDEKLRIRVMQATTWVFLGPCSAALWSRWPRTRARGIRGG
jgi:predicted metal-dependent hydrolase